MIPIESKFPPGLIGIPTGSMPRFNEFWDSQEMLRVPEGTGYMRISGARLAANRNRIVREMLMHEDWKWVLFLDDDQVFDPMFLLRLLARLYPPDNVQVVTALYRQKIPPFDPILFSSIGDYDQRDFSSVRVTWEELNSFMKTTMNGLLQVEGAGAGGLLVKRNVLEGLPVPFPVLPAPNVGDDLGFCYQLKKLGIPLFCDVRVTLGHTASCTVWPHWSPERKEWMLGLGWGDLGMLLESQRVGRMFRGGR